MKYCYDAQHDKIYCDTWIRWNIFMVHDKIWDVIFYDAWMEKNDGWWNIFMIHDKNDG
jgi:hypothetical protein